ncbi:hypothetical protein ACHAWF_016989 [Thalassiosira exigua]
MAHRSIYAERLFERPHRVWEQRPCTDPSKVSKEGKLAKKASELRGRQSRRAISTEGGKDRSERMKRQRASLLGPVGPDPCFARSPSRLWTLFDTCTMPQGRRGPRPGTRPGHGAFSNPALLDQRPPLPSLRPSSAKVASVEKCNVCRDAKSSSSQLATMILRNPAGSKGTPEVVGATAKKSGASVPNCHRRLARSTGPRAPRTSTIKKRIRRRGTPSAFASPDATVALCSLR